MTRQQALALAKPHIELITGHFVRQCPCGEWFFNANAKFKYCSEQCATEINKLQKRVWWHKNGETRRRYRQTKTHDASQA